MRAPLTIKSRTIWWASFAAWTFVGLFSLAQGLLRAETGGRDPVTAGEVFRDFESLWLWALFTPPIMVIAGKLPLDRGRRSASLLAHLGVALAVSFLDVVLDGILLGTPGSLLQRALAEAFINCFSYAGVAAVGYAVIYGRASAEERAHRAELQQRFVEVRLEALTAKLRPHFLFNALNSVAALIRLGDREQALAAVVALGDLLRAVITVGGDERVTLEKELEWIERYLAIERIRFQDRLQTEVRIDDHAENALVPALVLQPIVENAIRHGLEQRRGAGVVRIEAHRSGDHLSLLVSDSGEGTTQEEAHRGFGFGLESTRERLAHFYGADHFTLELSSTATGSTARISIPFHEPERGN